MRPPRIFIGSSKEGLRVAEAIEQNLQHVGEVVCWPRMFEIGKTVYDQLLTKSRTFQFAVLVFTPDDMVRMRGQEHPIARDNVVFELGLFLGQLGPERTFVIKPRSSVNLQLPTDLLGVVPGDYEDNRSDGDLKSAVAPFTTDVRNAIEVYTNLQRQATLRADAQLVTVVEQKGHRDGSVEFYETFQSHLLRTTDTVVIIGSGFHCADRRSTDLAARYLRILSGCALRHEVVRVEMADPGMKRWGQMVADYLAPMTNVEILLPKKGVRQSMLLKDVCLMDPGTDHAVVEMMVPRLGISSTADSTVEFAGEGLFIRSPKIADSFSRLVYDLRKKKLVARATGAQLREYFGLAPEAVEDDGETVYYFAYGSNMREAQMRNRVRTSKRIGSARLAGFRLSFNIPGALYSAGVCNVVPDRDSEVCGVLYSAGKAEFLRRMDFYEGVDEGEYERVNVPVLLDSGQKLSAFIYLSRRDTSEVPPSRAYLNLVLQGARENGLPAEYIRTLEMRAREAT